ncbi:MAG: hypothetical protein R2762_28360 [Bryobacteraceae bacterium]
MKIRVPVKRYLLDAIRTVAVILSVAGAVALAFAAWVKDAERYQNIQARSLTRWPPCLQYRRRRSRRANRGRLPPGFRGTRPESKMDLRGATPPSSGCSKSRACACVW